MDKLRINLIPPEIKELEKKDARRAFVNRMSILFLGVLVLITAGILGVVIYQRVSVDMLNSSIEQEKQKIIASKDKEVVVRLLKDRVDTINKFSGNRYKQGEIFNTMTKLFPQGISLGSIQISKSASVDITGETSDTQSLQNFFDMLTDPKTNEGLIASVTLESLNQSQKGSIRFSLRANLASGVNP